MLLYAPLNIVESHSYNLVCSHNAHSTFPSWHKTNITNMAVLVEKLVQTDSRQLTKL